MHARTLCSVVCMLTVWTSVSPTEQPAVGATPQTQAAPLQIRGIPAAQWLRADEPPDIGAFRGRLWMLAILEPWSSRSLSAAARLARIHQSWSQRGVAAVLLTVEPADATRPILDRIGSAVPVGCESPLPMLLPLEPLPRAYLIGPDGVAVWSGPVDSLATVLRAHYRKLTPEGLSADRAAELADLLTEARSALEGKDSFRALGLAQTVSRATPASHPLHAEAGELLARLNDLAEGMLTEADRLLQQNKPADAYDLLQDVAEQFYGTKPASRAMAKLQELKNDRPAFAAVLSRRDRISAERTLELARRAVSEGRYGDAERYYRLILDLYPHTPAGPTARSALDELLADASSAAELAVQKVWPDARVLLALARRYRQIDRFDEARRCYQQVLRRFGGTPFAEQARKALATLPAASPTTQPH